MSAQEPTLKKQHCWTRRSFLLSIVLLGVTLAPSPARTEDPPNAGKDLRIVRDDETVGVYQGGQLLLSYRYRGRGHKPYVAEFAAPGGVNVLRDAPADHLHHHGLMFACRVNGVNFWEEPADSGREVHAEWVSVRVVPGRSEYGAPERAVLHERLRWQGPDGKTLLEEDRLLCLPAPRPGEPRVLTWQTTLIAPSKGGTVTLTGTAYNGLGARFLAAMDKSGRFLNAAGSRGVTDTKGKHVAWCSYTAEPRPGTPITAVIFDAPNNPRHPTRWYTMDQPFAYLSASLGADTEPIKLAAGQRLTLRWGMALLSGIADKDKLDTLYRQWQPEGAR